MICCGTGVPLTSATVLQGGLGEGYVSLIYTEKPKSIQVQDALETRALGENNRVEEFEGRATIDQMFGVNLVRSINHTGAGMFELSHISYRRDRRAPGRVLSVLNTTGTTTEIEDALVV